VTRMTTPAADAECLRLAILANPADDAPRLQLADELEASEPERALAIRVMCREDVRGHTVRAHGGKPVYCNFDGAAHRLFVLTCPPWAAAVEWRRGFIERVECQTANWLTHGPALAAAHPLEAVTLSDKRPSPGINHGNHWLCRPADPALAERSVFYLPPAIMYATAKLRPLGDLQTISFPDRKAADEWLSKQCLAYARAPHRSRP
jgi:uncharacterized protein (TIGR02996 family)